jgi:site-specific DNA-adenine methylase
MRRDSRTNTFTGYDADKIAENYERTYMADGVIFWSSNDRCPFEDMLTDFAEAGFISFIDVRRTLAYKEKQDAEAIAEYIEARKNRTQEQIEEERFEMLAAFGPGEKVVNVFTGEVTYL